MAHLSMLVDLATGDQFEVLSHPADRHGAGFVVLSLAELRVSVRAENLPALDALVTATVEARDWLTAEVAGQSSLPVEAEPIGDTGLMLHPLPVGVA